MPVEAEQYIAHVVGFIGLVGVIFIIGLILIGIGFMDGGD